MKCLVVTAHPLADSLCHSIASDIKEELAANGHTVIDENLYAQEFNAALTASERSSYYGAFDDADLKENIARLKEAEMLVLVFPTWWFGFPAILKGWFDRVWAPGVAFENTADLGAIKPKLDNLTNVLAVTTLGSPWWVDWFVMFRPMKRIIKTALFGACARQVKFKFFCSYQSEKLTENQVSDFKSKILKYVGSLA